MTFGQHVLFRQGFLFGPVNRFFLETWDRLLSPAPGFAWQREMDHPQICQERL